VLAATDESRSLHRVQKMLESMAGWVPSSMAAPGRIVMVDIAGGKSVGAMSY